MLFLLMKMLLLLCVFLLLLLLYYAYFSFKMLVKAVQGKAEITPGAFMEKLAFLLNPARDD